jgi:hypothetical protein
MPADHRPSPAAMASSSLASTPRVGSGRTRLAAAYKQLNAPFGDFGHASEIVSTKAVDTNSPGDAEYLAWDNQLQRCGSSRDTVAGQIKTVLDNVEFGGAALDQAMASTLISESQTLISQLQALSQQSTPPATTACHI